MGLIYIEFDRLFDMGFLFGLRIQAGGYPKTRLSLEGALLNRTPMRRPVRIGLRDVFGKQN